MVVAFGSAAKTSANLLALDQTDMVSALAICPGNLKGTIPGCFSPSPFCNPYPPPEPRAAFLPPPHPHNNPLTTTPSPQHRHHNTATTTPTLNRISSVRLCSRECNSIAPSLIYSDISIPHRQKYGVKCDGHSCTASDGAMIEIVGMGGPDGCTISVPEDIPKDVADVWGGDCTRSQSGINHVTCDGGEWHVMQTWSWFLEGNSGRYLCHGRKLLPLSQCEAPFKVTKYDPTPDAGKSVEPIGGLGAQLQMCLPAGQEWDPNTTVKVAASSSLTWSKADEVDIGGGLEFSSGANILMPEAKWTAHFDAKHTYTQGGTTTSTEEQTVGNQFKMPVLKEYDQFINIRAQQFLYKVDVVLTGKSGCCEDPKYDHTGCDKDKDVKVEVSLTTSSSDFTDTNLLCIQKDPW